jgi:hypothetical protein
LQAIIVTEFSASFGVKNKPDPIGSKKPDPLISTRFDVTLKSSGK